MRDRPVENQDGWRGAKQDNQDQAGVRHVSNAEEGRSLDLARPSLLAQAVNMVAEFVG
jgi:hypothetical protein